ncbi:MAG: hypothetical protein ACTSPR_06575 [Candidatus Thorarchaeota archaeon]
MARFSRFFEQNAHETQKQRRSILSALSSGPSTIANLVSKTSIPENLVVWNIMGLLKWGDVEVAGEKNHQILYASREV